jgi:hypothetical protein
MISNPCAGMTMEALEASVEAGGDAKSSLTNGQLKEEVSSRFVFRGSVNIHNAYCSFKSFKCCSTSFRGMAGCGRHL